MQQQHAKTRVVGESSREEGEEAPHRDSMLFGGDVPGDMNSQIHTCIHYHANLACNLHTKRARTYLTRPWLQSAWPSTWC